MGIRRRGAWVGAAMPRHRAADRAGEAGSPERGSASIAPPWPSLYRPADPLPATGPLAHDHRRAGRTRAHPRHPRHRQRHRGRAGARRGRLPGRATAWPRAAWR